jgi:long-subunit fatty acid transport protein
MKKIILTLFLVTLIVTETPAQLFPTLGGQRAGISTAQFLKIPVGSRSTAMGDAFVAVADDATALYWNPAGMSQTQRNEVVFSHNVWVVDIQHEFLGGTYHLSPNDVVGASVIALHMDDMEKTTETMPFGTGEYFTFSDIAFSLSYSRKFTDKFSFGLSLRYIEETMAELKMRGFMIDLGTYYWTGLGSTRFAVTVSNFGNQLSPEGEVTLFNGEQKSSWQSFSPPTVFRIGFAFEPYQTDIHRITSSVQLNHPNDNSENVAAGFEYAWQEMFFARGGYKLNKDEQNFTFGAGVKLPLAIADVTVDYAYQNFVKLGSSHRFSILLGL